MTSSPGGLRTVAYWVLTLFLALTALGSGVVDVLHLPPMLAQLLHLGYPAYFGTLLGVWKILGALALLAPRSPLVKEWAYAGFFIDYSAAFVSWMAVGGGAADLSGPVLSIVALVLSWKLRPRARRLIDT